MTEGKFTEFHRLRFWQGQLLRSQDFRDQIRISGELRAWHNRALHNAYGIREGLNVVLNDPPVDLTVSAGLAYDCYGREIILTEDQSIPIPEGRIPNDGLILYLCFSNFDNKKHSDDLTGACLPIETPNSMTVCLKWKQSQWVDPREGVPLRRVKVDPDGAKVQVLSEFPTVRPLASPRMAHGATLSGNTAWRLWVEEKTPGTFDPRPQKEREEGVKEEIKASATQNNVDFLLRSMARVEPPQKITRFLGLEVQVNTSAAGFTETPCYYAWTQGSLWDPKLVKQFTPILGLSGSYAFNQLSGGQRTRAYLAPLLLLNLVTGYVGHIHNPTSTGFVYRIWFPQAVKWVRNRRLFDYLITLAQQGSLIVCWIGLDQTICDEVKNGTPKRTPIC